MRSLQRGSVEVLAGLFLALGLAWASITGSISGVVTDPSGAVISGAAVAATNTQTGVKTKVTTDSKGFYSLPALPIGTYDLLVTQAGFKSYTQSGLVIDANVYLVDMDGTLLAAIEHFEAAGSALLNRLGAKQE